MLGKYTKQAAKLAFTNASMLGKYTKQAAKLAFTNAKPKLYAMSAMGLSPTKRAKCRSLLCRPLGVKKTGGCLTMALAAHRLHHKDPGLTLAVDNIVDCVAALIQSPEKLTAIAWERALDNLSGSHRWAYVRGPLSSMIATLLDFHWAPEAYNKWYDPTGRAWHIDYSAPNLVSMVREVLTHFFTKKFWDDTHQFYPMCNGTPDLTYPWDAFKRFQKQGLHRHSYWLDAILQGTYC